MNLAIDRLLEPDERGELDAQLDRSPDDAHLWNTMKRVDQTLRTAPLTSAPSGFSGRLLTALAAGRQPCTDPRSGLGIAVGLWTAALIMIPLMSAVVIIALHALLDAATLQALASRSAALFQSLGTLANVLIRSLSQFVSSNPAILALSAVLLPILAIWSWLAWTVSMHNPPITYRIPVRILA